MKILPELTPEKYCIFWQQKAYMSNADSVGHLRNGMPLGAVREQNKAAFCYREMWAYLAELIGVDHD